MSLGSQIRAFPVRQYKRSPAFALTIGIHLFLFVLWQSQSARQHIGRQPAGDPEILWLLNPQASAVQAQRNVEEEPPIDATTLQRPSKKPSVVSSEDTVTLPHPSGTSPAPDTQVITSAAPVEPEAPQVMPLNLSLPSSASRLPSRLLKNPTRPTLPAVRLAVAWPVD